MKTGRAESAAGKKTMVLAASLPFSFPIVQPLPVFVQKNRPPLFQGQAACIMQRICPNIPSQIR